MKFSQYSEVNSADDNDYLLLDVTPISSDSTSKITRANLLDSAALGGTPTATTAAPSTNTTQIATTAFVEGEVATAILAGVPDATTISKGKIQLAGDLAGTAASPIVKGRFRVYDVRDPIYGAVLNGITDDTIAINNAITAANTAGGGIVLLSGYAATTAPIILKSNVTLQGIGQGASGLIGADTDYIILKTTKSGTSKTAYSNVGIADLTIKSKRGYCTRLDNISNLWISNVEVTFTATPLVRESLMIEHCQYVRIDSPYVHDVAGNGLQINGCDYVVVNGPIIHDTFDDSIDIDKDFVDTKAVPSRWITINGGSVSGVTNGNGMRIAGSQYVSINGIAIDGVAFGGAASGIEVNSYNESPDPATTDISIRALINNCSYAGINIVDAGGGGVTNVSINGGEISDSGTAPNLGALGAGIILAATGVTVTGVALKNCGISGADGGAILFFKTNGHHISNNTVTGSATGITGWNGSGTEVYTGVSILDNKMSGNITNYNYDVLTQIGIVVRTISANGIGIGKDTATSLLDVDGTITSLANQVNGNITSTGATSITTAVASNLIPLTITQNDTTNNPRAMRINNAGSNTGLYINQTFNSGTASQALIIDDSNTTAGNQTIRVNSNRGTEAVRIQNSGTGNVLVGGDGTNDNWILGRSGTQTLADAANITVGISTGTKIGTATTQKLGFYNATPIVQPLATTEVGTMLSNLGLRAAGSAYPITTTGAVSTGNLTLGTAGNKINITTGSNASAGTGTLTGGTVTINTTAVTASSLIFLTDTASSITNVGTLTVSAKSAGTSFTVTSTIALDTSTFNWLIVN